MVELELFVVVSGDDTPFSIDIMSSENVSDLQGIIWEKRKTNTFEGMDAKDLRLWKVTVSYLRCASMANSSFIHCSLIAPYSLIISGALRLLSAQTPSD